MALLDNKDWTSEALTLKDGVLKTNGALVSMKAPTNWLAGKTSKSLEHGLPDQTILFCKKNLEGSNTSLGVFVSGIPRDGDDGQQLRKDVFEKQINMSKGSAEAKKFQAEEGALRNTTQLSYLLISTAPHAIHTQEANCLSFRTTEFKGMKAAIIECESEQLNIKSIEYCIDVSGNGRVVYSLYYKASIADFAEDLALAQAAFESTVWRADFDPTINLDAAD